jgi:hypothetical protein
MIMLATAFVNLRVAAEIVVAVGGVSWSAPEKESVIFVFYLPSLQFLTTSFPESSS